MAQLLNIGDRFSIEGDNVVLDPSGHFEVFSFNLGGDIDGPLYGGTIVQVREHIPEGKPQLFRSEINLSTGKVLVHQCRA